MSFFKYKIKISNSNDKIILHFFLFRWLKTRFLRIEISKRRVKILKILILKVMFWMVLDLAMFCFSKIKSKFRILNTWEIVIFWCFAGWKKVFSLSKFPRRRVKILKIFIFESLVIVVLDGNHNSSKWNQNFEF
jgi:hypothetical protein